MKYTSIAGLSAERRIPRAGKIRLGEKVNVGQANERPTATDHFVVPPEVAAAFGEKPTAIDVMLPSEDMSVIFPVAYKFYKRSLLWCTGNGQQASRLNEDGKGFAEIECPCSFLEQKGACRHAGSLMVMIPKVSVGGVYQLDTPSRNNIVAIQSGIEHARSLLGRVSWVPFTLSLSPRQMLADGKMKTVYLVSLVLASFEQIQQTRLQLQGLRALVAPTSSEPVALIAEPEEAPEEHEVAEAEVVGGEPSAAVAEAAQGKQSEAPAPPPPASQPAAIEIRIRALAVKLKKAVPATNVAIGTAKRKGTLDLLEKELERQLAGGKGPAIDWSGSAATAAPPPAAPAVPSFQTLSMTDDLYDLGESIGIEPREMSALVKSAEAAGEAAVATLHAEWTAQAKKGATR